jgi:hypothetical protein
VFTRDTAVPADLLGEQVEGGVIPSWAHIRDELAATMPMVSASYLPLLALVLARVAGASALVAANIGLITAALLLTFHAWDPSGTDQFAVKRLAEVRAV